MAADFAKALRESVRHASSSDRVESIKSAVTAEVRSADPAVFVRHTQYFNHVAVPDMVLRWPNEDRERLLFLRPNADPHWLLADLEGSLGNHHAMIFTLEDSEVGTDDIVHAADKRLAAVAGEKETWITGPSALEEVATARTKSSVGGLLGQALVRGGRGVASQASVQRLARSTEEAFEKAASQDVDAVASSIGALETVLAPQQAGRITRVLRAIWEGHGGASSTFPTVASTGALSDDDLTYLLLGLEDAPADFWGRVGRGVSSAQLGNLDLPDPSRSLQVFISANIDSLSAKGLRVLPQQVRLGEPDEFPRWSIERGCLALRGMEWTAYVAARKAEELPPAVVGKAPAFETLKARVADSAAVLTKVQFGKGDRAMTYESKHRLNVSADADLAQMAQQVDGLAVEEASLAVAGGAVNLDFSTATGLGPTSSSLPLGPLLRSALPLLVTLRSDEAAAVAQRLLAAPEATLFDEAPVDIPSQRDALRNEEVDYTVHIEIDDEGGAIVYRGEGE